MLLSDRAYEKLCYIIYNDLPIVEQYLIFLNLEFDLLFFEKVIKESAYGISEDEKLRNCIRQSESKLKNKIKFALSLENKEQRTVLNSLINIIYTRILQPSNKKNTTIYLEKILLLQKKSNGNDSAILFLWDKLLDYYDSEISKNKNSNYPGIKQLSLQSFNYWSKK